MKTKHGVLFGLAGMMAVGLLACLPGGGGAACDPELDDQCVCETDEGEACDDPSDLDCSCSLPLSDLGEEDNQDQEGNQKPSLRFVMIEDMTARVAGNAPGADLDAVGLLKANGGERFATAVEDFELGLAGNEYGNVNEILGSPDANCQKQGFVSLGGQSAGSYVIVSFGTDTEDVIIENGDSIRVYELGSTLCPNAGYDDDPYRVAVSVSTDLGSFIEVGTGGEGRNTLPIRGL